eukprot:GAFH01001301.1.p1 GENE.GAFH01001301.1~~GAFH01001301.1.p1  ORF type:complete len:476 (-),score=194.75 GAFH01001301.1:313-1611(-)
MLEMFQLRKQLEEAQQELSHALYQHDAACRVIARLIKERDQARSALAQLQATAVPAAAPAAPAAAEAPEVAGGMEVEKEKGISQEIIQKMQATQKQLSTARKVRTVSPTLAAPEAFAAYTCTSTHPLHKTTQPGIACLALGPDQHTAATGGMDGQVVLFNTEQRQVTATLAGHAKRVTDVLFHPTQPQLYSSSADRTVRVWGQKDGQWSQQGQMAPAHQGEVTGLGLHPSGEFLVSGATDDTWAFYDLASAQCLAQVQNPNPEPKRGIQCVQFHPDGLILGTAGDAAVVKLWDVKTQANVAKCEGFAAPVKTLSFSENGFYLASASNDNSVRLWDLRKLSKARANFRTITLPDEYVVQHVAFDYSGNYLLVTGTDVRLFNTKTWAELAVLPGHEGPVSSGAFGPDAASLVTASMDRTLRLWGPAPAPSAQKD